MAIYLTSFLLLVLFFIGIKLYKNAGKMRNKSKLLFIIYRTSPILLPVIGVSVKVLFD